MTRFSLAILPIQQSQKLVSVFVSNVHHALKGTGLGRKGGLIQNHVLRRTNDQLVQEKINGTRTNPKAVHQALNRVISSNEILDRGSVGIGIVFFFGVLGKAVYNPGRIGANHNCGVAGNIARHEFLEDMAKGPCLGRLVAFHAIVAKAHLDSHVIPGKEGIYLLQQAYQSWTGRKGGEQLL